MSTLDLARTQFGMTTLFHFIFVPMSIGLAAWVAVCQTLYHRPGREVYLRMTRLARGLGSTPRDRARGGMAAIDHRDRVPPGRGKPGGAGRPGIPVAGGALGSSRQRRTAVSRRFHAALGPKADRSDEYRVLLDFRTRVAIRR